MPCAPSATIFCSFGPIIVSFAVRDSLSTMLVSGVTWPPTTASPSPKLALTIISDRSPVAGFAVKRMPETSEGTMACATTAIATDSWSMPF